MSVSRRQFQYFIAVVLHPRWNPFVNSQATFSTRAIYFHKRKTAQDLKENIRNERTPLCCLRREALRLRDKRNKYFNMAADAHKRGQGRLAKIFAERGHQTNSVMKTVNAQAASQRLLTENAFTEPNKLNVHGLYVHEAISAISEHLNSHLHQQGKVTIITGWGRNSPTHLPRLLPAVKLYLTEQGYDFQQPSAGVIEVSQWTS